MIMVVVFAVFQRSSDHVKACSPLDKLGECRSSRFKLSMTLPSSLVTFPPFLFFLLSAPSPTR